LNHNHTISILETFDIVTGERRVLNTFDYLIEAPNWLRDGETLIFNSDGHIYKYDIAQAQAVKFDTGMCLNCNNDHVPSPDNSLLAVSDNSAADGKSHIYALPMSGGKPRLITAKGNSYLHGWSVDGQTLTYCAIREDNGNNGEIYTISAAGGDETNLTLGEGFNDGPEFAPDDHIWFNSTRSGLMQIYRMDRDGGNVTMMTHTESNNWFAHVSPDGQKVVYLAYQVRDLQPHQHLANKNVEIRLIDIDGCNTRPLMTLFGGQGTINVNSWSPDSRKIAFVSYSQI
jgi:Tol biopolymer transport system component